MKRLANFVLLSVLLLLSGCGGGDGGGGGGTSTSTSTPPPPQTQTFTILHAFNNGPTGAGEHPGAGLIRDAAGNLYGTTVLGGTSGFGTVFRLDTAGEYEVLYSFTGAANGPDGALPHTGLIRDAVGNLYGTTFTGGASGFGTVFKLDATGKETILYSFAGGGNGPDGVYPQGLVRDSAGTLYGTTQSGGTSGIGTVFKLDTAGKYEVLYSFNGDSSGPDGAYPQAGLIRDAAGNLYGTTNSGGATGHGTVFKVDAAGTETVLYSFMGGKDGQTPMGTLTRDEAGNLYGTTLYGAGTVIGGTVFKLDANGQLTTIHSFAEDLEGDDKGGQGPSGVLLRAGNLYGTTGGGGASKFGVIFRLNVESGLETVLHTFTGGGDGRGPNGDLIADSNGNLYGTTFWGGDTNSCRSAPNPYDPPSPPGCGVMFKIKLP